MSHARYEYLADKALVQWPAIHSGLSPKQALVRYRLNTVGLFLFSNDEENPQHHANCRLIKGQKQKTLVSAF